MFTDDIDIDSLWPQSENMYVSNKFFFILYALFHKWKFKSQDGKRGQYTAAYEPELQRQGVLLFSRNLIIYLRDSSSCVKTCSDKGYVS